MEESLEMQLIRKMQERIEQLKSLLDSCSQMLELTNSSLDDFVLSGAFPVPPVVRVNRRRTSKSCKDAIMKIRAVVNHGRDGGDQIEH